MYLPGITLGSLFDTTDLLADPCNSGVYTDSNVALVVSPELDNPFVWSGILNLVARLAFATVACDLPLVVTSGQKSGKPLHLVIDFQNRPDPESGNLLRITRPEATTVVLASENALYLRDLLNTLAINPLAARPGALTSEIGLPQVFREPAAAPPASNRRSEKIDLLRLDRLYESADLSARALAFSWLLAAPRLSAATGIALSEALVTCVMEATQVTQPLLVYVDPEIPPAGTCFVMHETEPEHGGMTTPALAITQAPFQEKIFVSGSPAAFQNGIGPWFKLAVCRGGMNFGLAETLRNTEDLTARQSDRPHTDVTPICHDFQWPGESEAILVAIAELAPGTGRLVCDVYASKPPELRRQLQQTVQKRLTSKGYTPEVRVFNAFKPGLSRLLEDMLPRLANRAVAHIEIACRLFTGVDGALELKHRWIHELFPAPEILARELGLDRTRVCLTVDAKQTGTYCFTALNAMQEPIFQDIFSPFTQTMFYHPAASDIRTISPTCAGIRIFKDEQLMMEKAIPTDRDRFWRLFQEQAVPDLLAAMKAQRRAGLPARQTTFFDAVELEIAIDESDVKLGFRDERINPMEALQEDIYFFLLDMTRQFTQTHKLPDGIHIGRILPRISAHTPQGKPFARLRATPSPAGSSHPKAPRMCERLSICGDHWRIGTNGGGRDITLPVAALHNLTASSADTSPADLVIPEDRPLYAHEVETILFALGRHPDIQIWEIARSTLGRPIYAAEAFHCPHDCVSIPRLRQARPTVLFNARHHANEVSSTTAVLKLLKYLCTEGNAVLNRVNVVCIPLENVDGVATFESLYVPGRDDMLHAARYNAAGAEFYREYHREFPLFAEAWAKKRLWIRWLPALMADLHGVPGHEWCQPYAGYTPAGFEEFWLPRAFVWVHLPFLEDGAHPGHNDSLKLAAALGKAVADVPEIQAANSTLTTLYNTYARAFDTDVFPEATPGALTAHPLLGRARDYNYAVRHPAITRCEVVVEVPDEVVHGPKLALCITTHYVMQSALIQLLTAP